MGKYTIGIFMCVTLVMMGYSYSFAEDAYPDEKDVLLQRALNSPNGVFDVEYDDDGHLVRLKVKGDSEVPTSMTAARADRYAREKAGRDARANFIKFLSENVVFADSGGEGTVIQQKNGDESSEVLEASAKLYGSSSAAMVNGLIGLVNHLEGEGAGRTCTVIFGWSPKLSKAAVAAKAAMSNTSQKGVSPNEKEAAPGAAKKLMGNVETITRVGNLKDF